MKTLICVILLTTSMFITSSHPLMLGLMLMLLSFFYGVLTHLTMKTPWLAYLLIMVFLSGMMIILIYMTSLSSNELMFIDIKKLIILTSMMLMMISQMEQTLNEKFNIKNCFNTETLELIFKTYNSILKETTIMIILYLLVVLISAMKIIIMNKGPLRTKK